MICFMEVTSLVLDILLLVSKSLEGGGGGDPRMLERRKSVRLVGEQGGISFMGEILLEHSCRGLESGLLASSSVVSRYL